MKKVSMVLALTSLSALLLLSSFAVTHAQTPQQQPATAASQAAETGITPNSVIGEVTALNPSDNRLTVKTDAGALVTVMLDEKTNYLRLSPGEKSLKNATKIALADVGVGDRVWARGKVAEDKRSVPALALVVMTKADITLKQERERAEWRRRGLLGVITALNPSTKEITIQSRTREGQQAIIIPTSGTVEFRRYAPDSIKFSDARPSSFNELKIGDQLRALGDRSSDGTHFNPEVIVTGSFRTVGGTVTAVNAATGEVKINDQQTKQPLTIAVRQDSILRRFPAEMAAMMAQRGPGAGPNGTGPTGPTQGGANGAGPAGAAGPRRGGGFDFQEVLERLPVIAVTDLKAGDMIIVSSTTGAEPSRVTAIALVSGVEPLLQALQARQQQQQSQQPGGARPAPNPANGLGSGINFGIGLP